MSNFPLSFDFSALDATQLLDTPPELAFDRLTALAAKVLKAPVALVSLVDRNRQFFKSQCGLAEPWASLRETPLSHSFCQHVVVIDEPLVIRDAREHPLVYNNLAIRDIGVIAYAGVPIRNAKNGAYGAFCVIDGQPRDWTRDELEILNALAAQVGAEVELRVREMELRESVQRLQQLEVERQRMTRFTVHDLRTPLNALLLSMEAMPLFGELTATQRDCLAISLRNGHVIVTMVDDLLDIGAIEDRGPAALALKDFKPRELVSSAIDQIAPLAKDKGLRLENNALQDLEPITIDADKVVRVLVNLLANAVKFTDGGGSICVAARQDERGRGTVFSVADTGSGIAKDDVERIFDEGVRLDTGTAPGLSAGLGLTFCKRIVEAHGGAIWVESAPGKGSEFSFSLPHQVAISRRASAFE